MLQRRRGVRGHHDDKGCASLQREGCLDSASDLQVIMRDRRQVLSVRPTDVLYEVRIMDIRWISGKNMPCCGIQVHKFLQLESKT